MELALENRFLQSRLARLLQGDGLPQTAWGRYLWASAAFGAALLLRFALLPNEPGVPFFTFYPAVLAAALLLGSGPGSLVIALSTLAAWHLFMPHRSSLALDLESLPPVLAFVLSSAVVCWLADGARRAVRSLGVALHDQRAILDSRVSGILKVIDRRVVWANEKYASMFGYSQSEIIGRSTRMFFPSDEAWADFAPKLRSFIDRGEVFGGEFPLRLKSGEIRWFEITCAPLAHGRDEQIATAVDVTERRRVAEELQQARTDLQAVLDHIPARVSSWNVDWTNRFANREAERQLGCGPGGMTGRHVREIVGEERHQWAKPYMDAALAGVPQTYEQIDPEPDGSLRYSRLALAPSFRDGAVVGFYVLAVDITDLRTTEEALRESEHRLRAITDNIPVSIVLYDGEDRVQFANRLYRQRVARSDHDPNGTAVAEYMDPTIYRRNVEFRQRAQRGEVTRFTALDKAQRQIEVTYTPYRDASGAFAGIYGVGYDVTELRESHERIRELAERLATVREDERRAVAVRLHEGLGQELYAAHLSLRALEREGRGRSVITELARELSRVVDQSIEEVRSLTNELYPTSLTHLELGAALEQLANQFGRRACVAVIVHQSAEFPTLEADIRVLFFRAAQELLTNVGRHAGAANVSIDLEADAERIAMIVTDDGKGIGASDLHKAGSLGLLGIRERFIAFGGGLTIDSGAPSGTRVTVFVPAAAAAAETAAALEPETG
jgi:PAS domain S-box-containing protein